MSHSHKHHEDEKEKEPASPAPINIPVRGNISAGGNTLRSESPGATASQSLEDPDSALSLLAEQVKQLQAEKRELTDTMVRRQADFENFRKRLEKERVQDRQRAIESLIERVLPVLDAFERALAGQSESVSAEYVKGFELIRRQLWDALAKQGLSRIDSVGKKFDPHFHHAIEQVPSADHAEGDVIGELQPGYLLHDRVLRPAMVRVATEAESKSVSVSRSES